MPDEIDWGALEKYPEDTCFCRCGSVFRSHAKGVIVNGTWTVRSRKPCPECGKTNDLRKVSSDPETYTIK